MLCWHLFCASCRSFQARSERRGFCLYPQRTGLEAQQHFWVTMHKCLYDGVLRRNCVQCGVCKYILE